MACRRCEERGKTWEGSDPTCGFDFFGVFDPGNWNCATLNALRGYAEDHELVRYSDDDGSGRAALIMVPEPAMHIAEFVLLGWYKSRGRTDTVLAFHHEGNPVPLALGQAEFIVDLLEGKAEKPEAPPLEGVTADDLLEMREQIVGALTCDLFSWVDPGASER